MTEKVKLDCDNCGCTSTITYNSEENEGAEAVFCPFCGTEVIMVEEYDDDEFDDSWDDDEEWN